VIILIYFIVFYIAFFIVAGLTVATARSFGRDSLADAAISVIYSPITFFRLAKDESAKYQGPIRSMNDWYKKILMPSLSAENGWSL